MHKEKNVERFTISTPAAFPRDFCPVCIPKRYSKNRQNKGSKPLLDQHGTKLDLSLSSLRIPNDKTRKSVPEPKKY